MNINAVELMQFLGHSSIYEPFDDYLHSHGIKKRPSTTGRNIELSVSIKKHGLHLSFVESTKLAGEGLASKSSGSYVFNWLDIYLTKEDGMSPYGGPLPFGLTAELSQKQVRALLGQPKHVSVDPEFDTNADFFYVDDLVVAIKYTDMQGSAIRMINPCLPDNWAREHGIAPAT